MSIVGEIDAIEFNYALRDTYKRYLFTANMLSDKEKALQDSFRDKLDNDFEIIKGPFVHATPCYKSSFSVRQLVKGEGPAKLSASMLNLPEKRFDPDRPLYSHQVDAIQRLKDGNNLVVATGTGSGKTESYLLPILNSVLEDPSPGLRAIIIYPLNALANDQLFRLRVLLNDIPQVTFGRYTGETSENLQEKQGPINEREDRDSIRRDPPHILLTNFAMLEYLLLRPTDSTLFNSHKIQFVVLDEAHSYNGVQGIEISMLMRRLKQYLVGAKNNSIQFVLTSATIGDGASSKADIAKFASDLTGNPFNDDDVLTGETVNSFSSDLKDEPTPESLRASIGVIPFEKWSKALTMPEMLVDLLREAKFDLENEDEKSISRILYNVFHNYAPLARIHDLCRKTPVTIDEICDDLGLEKNDTGQHTSRILVTLGAYARKGQDYAPLLPTRLHFFGRGLAGASVCMNNDCAAHRQHPDTAWSDFFLEDRKRCPTCEKRVLPLLSCVHCGLPVIRVYVETGRWRKSEASPEDDVSAYYLSWSEDLYETVDEDNVDQNQTLTLCLSCRSIITEDSQCCSEPTLRKFYIIPQSDSGNVKTCPSCGGSGGRFGNVLREFTTGEDAPTAVLAETLMRHLPYDKKQKKLPANGRKLLVFSDSRQRAAFFAPYLMQTTAETAFHGPLQCAITNAEERANKPISFRKICNAFEDSLSEMATIVYPEKRNGVEYYEIIPKDHAREEQIERSKEEAEKRLYWHFCSSQRKKTTLTGMGIASLTFSFSAHEKECFPEQLSDFFALGEQKGWQLIAALLDIFIQRTAINFPNHVNSTDIVSQGSIVNTFHLANSTADKARNTIRWNPYLGPASRQTLAIRLSRQLDILCKAFNLDRYKDQEKLSKYLNQVWETFKTSILKDMPGCPGEYRLDRECLAVTTQSDWFVCDRCNKITTLGSLGFCTKVGCNGTPTLISKQDCEQKFGSNHYRNRYFIDPLPLQVNEHTAQLTNTCGKQYQEDFNDGKINVLSSSTTFEMGIDVGDLKSVMLRNIPPSASSYIQRVGRAGRRQDGVSVALTYARNVPHDQYNFCEPRNVIAGTVPVPYIHTANIPLAQRHCNSMMLGEFLRNYAKEAGIELDRPTVDAFFLVGNTTQTLCDKMAVWARSTSTKKMLLDALSIILPDDSTLSPDEAIEKAISTLCEDERSVLQFYVNKEVESYDKQIIELNTEMQQEVGGRRTRAAINLSTIERLKAKFLDRSLIGFLSSCSWLPGYAFPQDVIKLKVLNPVFSERLKLDRDREMAISEYAPGSEIIADGELFKSAGVEYKGEPEVRWYLCCRECRKIETGLRTERPPSTCSHCGCSFVGTTRARFYIKPEGFTTKIDDKPLKPSLNRMRPPRSSEVFLLEGAEAFEPAAIQGISIGIKHNGKLFRANRGHDNNSFMLCQTCGVHFEGVGRGRTHEKPWGSTCMGTPTKLDLAHEIVTDILQLRFQGCSPQPPRLNEDGGFWRSLVAAFMNGATDVLGIARGDVDATFNGWSAESFIGELVIYDRVPGGAGHIERIISNLEAVLVGALERVSKCTCSDLDSSCYACLRSYSNQFYWDQLQRRPVRNWLAAILHIEVKD